MPTTAGKPAGRFVMLKYPATALFVLSNAI